MIEAARRDSSLGCVLAVRTGVLDVWTDDEVQRATLDGGMLAQVARDRSRLPQVGEWVWLRRWPDGHLTVVCRAESRSTGATVLPFRRR